MIFNDFQINIISSVIAIAIFLIFKFSFKRLPFLILLPIFFYVLYKYGSFSYSMIKMGIVAMLPTLLVFAISSEYFYKQTYKNSKFMFIFYPSLIFTIIYNMQPFAWFNLERYLRSLFSFDNILYFIVALISILFIYFLPSYIQKTYLEKIKNPS